METFKLNLQDMNAYLQDLYASYPEAEPAKQAKVAEPIQKAYNLNNVIDHIKAGQYMVGSFTPSKGLSFSATPAIHNTEASARKECYRLAQVNPGSLYLFVKLCGGEMVPTVSNVSV